MTKTLDASGVGGMLDKAWSGVTSGLFGGLGSGAKATGETALGTASTAAATSVAALGTAAAAAAASLTGHGAATGIDTVVRGVNTSTTGLNTVATGVKTVATRHRQRNRRAAGFPFLR